MSLPALLTAKPDALELLPQVVGRKDVDGRGADGWRVVLLRGGVTLSALPPVAARALGRALMDMADLLDTTAVAASDPAHMWGIEVPETGVPEVHRANVACGSMPPVHAPETGGMEAEGRTSARSTKL